MTVQRKKRALFFRSRARIVMGVLDLADTAGGEPVHLKFRSNYHAR